MKKLIYITILLTIFISGIFASDYTNSLLDEAINHFSKKEYSEALSVVESVLELEPDNEIALMYKKTIEDVQNLDKATDLSTKDSVIDSPNDTEVKDEPSSEQEILKNSETSNDFINVKVLFGQSSSGDYVGQLRAKINFGLPVLECRLESESISYVINDFELSTIPYSSFFDFNNYFASFSAGARYSNSRGYFDLRLGAANLSLAETTVVPFLGYDFQFIAWEFGNLWVGSSGSLFNFNGDVVNNFEIEVSAGFKLSFFDIGWFYTYSSFDSVLESTNSDGTYGLTLGVNF